ncbi:tail fiber domain-containing protein [Oscillatoria amoena NRMC-F 0135]|nr:tail fiber domain-containing protein [Oscillatoria amoena NRMC-F 0135]
MKNFINCFKWVKAALFFVALTSSAYFASAQYTVEWTNLVNVSTSSGGTTITKTGGFGYEGRAVSINELPTCVDGTIEFTASNVSTQSRYIGFTTNGGSTTADIVHGIVISYGYFHFMLNGTASPSFPVPPLYTPTGIPVSNGDRFKIERVGNQVTITALDCISSCPGGINQQSYSISTPSTVWKVAGAMFNDGDAIANVTVNFGKPVTCSVDLWDRNRTTGSLFNIYQNDNVGIGTLSPSERLDVNGKARVRTLDVDNTLSNLIVADANGVLKKKTDPWTRNAGSGFLYTTTSTDRLGVGTTSPTEKLDVDGTARLRSITEDNTLSKMLVADATGVVKYKNLGGWFKQGTSTIPNAITDDIFTSGKVKIEKQLEVSSTFSLWGTGIGGATYDRFVLYADATNGLLFEAPRLFDFNNAARTTITFGWRGGTTAMSMVPSGSSAAFIGIGTATPAEKLHVTSGNIATTTGNFIDKDLVGGGTTGASVDNTGSIIRTPSDLRLKENIVTIENNLDKILKLRPVVYNYIDRDKYGEGKTIGFIAQEVETIIPEVVKKADDDYQLRSLNYVEVIPVLTGAIKEQQEIITTQNQRIDQLEKEMEEIKALLKNQGGAQPSQQSPASTGSMNVVPNPTYGKTTVNYTIGGDYANASVIVYNELGQKVGEYVITQKGNGSVEVDATSFAGGAYFCKLVVDENIREVKKFIVSK